MQEVAGGAQVGKAARQSLVEEGHFRKELGSEGTLGKGPTRESLKVISLSTFILCTSAQETQLDPEQFFWF